MRLVSRIILRKMSEYNKAIVHRKLRPGTLVRRTRPVLALARRRLEQYVTDTEQ